MTMFMAHNGRIALGDPNAAETAAWAALVTATLADLDRADQALRQSFLHLSAAAQQQGGLHQAPLEAYNVLATQLDTFNANVLQALRTTLPALKGLPSQIRRLPRVGYTPTEAGGPLLTDLTWNTAGCLGAVKTTAAKEAVEWLGVKIFGAKIATAAAGVAVAGLTVGGIAWVVTRNDANRLALQSRVQKDATGIYATTNQQCLNNGGTPDHCADVANKAYANYIKSAVQPDSGGGGWGFFKWLGVLGLAGVGLVIFQRYRAGAFPFAPGSGHGWQPAYALPHHPRTIKEDKDEDEE